jgi:hypothetical protein
MPMRFLGIFLILCCAHPVRAASRESVVMVQGERVVLGDVMRAVPVAMRSLDLGASPAPGEARVFTRAEIEEHIIDARLGPKAQSVLREVPKRVVVRRAHQVFSAIELKKRVIKVLDESLPSHVQVLRVHVHSGLMLPVGPVEIELDIPSKFRNGEQALSAWARVGDYERVRVHAKAHFRMRADTSHASIRRGSTVSVVVMGQNVTVRAQGVAQQGGKSGDAIPVLVEGGKRVVHGRINDEGVVEVQL